MSTTSKSVQAGNKQLTAENKAALKAKFPKAKLLTQFAKMAEATGSEAESREAKQATAFIVCAAAEQYRADAYGTGTGQTNDVSTILDAWRAHWRGLIKELHAKASPFVEMGEANKKGEQRPVMTGYGRNVASNARGIIEYDISTVDDTGAPVAYTEMGAAIVKERRANLPDERRDINNAKDALSEELAEIRKALGTNTVAIALFAGIVTYCWDAMSEYGASDGLAAVSLALEDTDLSDFLAVELVTEPETDTDESANDDTAETVEAVPVVVAAS